MNLPTDHEPMVIGGEVVAPIVVVRVEPEWPEKVTRDTFWLFSAVVTKGGRVKDLKLTMGQPGAHSRAAERANKQWRFKPGTYRGRPVDVKYDLSARVHLR